LQKFRRDNPAFRKQFKQLIEFQKSNKNSLRSLVKSSDKNTSSLHTISKLSSNMSQTDVNTYTTTTYRVPKQEIANIIT
jgi:hypothetical protein